MDIQVFSLSSPLLSSPSLRKKRGIVMPNILSWLSHGPKPFGNAPNLGLYLHITYYFEPAYMYSYKMPLI
jgi:hypothetical protein